jgi:phosphohistidine swiveling domain-containing protein
MPNNLLLSLDSPTGSLETTGGKALNLSRLARRGFPVPGGYLIPVAAYLWFCEANQLTAKIASLLTGASLEQPAILESLSQTIRGLFDQGSIPADLEEEILSAYRAMSSLKVAVRSSATAEDLPEISFAGQQDTFLNVSGEDKLLEAVVRCWSSLWTARAIGYRHYNGTGQTDLGLAVIVQEMVPSQVSGVVFTANPVTGRRTEMVIDATLGLGEALVSGKVEPDHYVVNMPTRQVTSKGIGAKALVIEGLAEGGTVERKRDGSQIQALPDELILSLAEMCQRVAEEYGVPQDIEFAWAGGKLYLLQSRPITSLYPTPQNVPYAPLRVMFSLGAVQGFLEPFTPLGQDALRLALSGLGAFMGYTLNYQDPGLLQAAGERLWIGFTSLVKNKVGRELIQGIMSFVEPTVGYHLKPVLAEPELAAQKGVKVGTILHILRLALPVISRMMLAMVFPKARRQRGMQIADRSLAGLGRQAHVKGIDPLSRLGERINLLRRITRIFPQNLPTYFVAPLAAGMASLNLVNQLLKHFLGTTQGDLAGMQSVMLQLTRGLPYNVTTEMDLFLWKSAQAIREDPGSMRYFREHSSEELAEAYQNTTLPATAQQAVGAFMDRYGMRGVGEIDLGRPRWREEPLQIMKVLVSYLQIADERKAPDAVFRRNAEEAEKTIAQMDAQIRQTRGGKLKSRLFRFAASRVRQLVGLRESPKFFIVRTMGIVRQSILESGRELKEAGIFSEPEDIFFLFLEELERLSRGEKEDWKKKVAEHRRTYEREKLRRQIPTILFSDGRAFYGAPSVGIAEGEGSMAGSPVSPGVVEGTVRVVFSPHETTLEPGEVLVCPGTDPAWTPLFLAAGGLVMEVGGMMTHGAVVAREYGIPAVVGVANATRLLKTGQRVRVDGGSGIIEVLERNFPDQGIGDRG